MSIFVIVYFVILKELFGLLQIIVPAHKLELWPGYVTSIRQHETDILMCCEINHKVMRQETALELLSSFAHGDAKMYKVSVMSLLPWEAAFVHLPNVHYLFVCNVQKHLTLQKCARSKFVFAVFSKVQIMLALVILCLCTDWNVHKPIRVQSCQKSYMRRSRFMRFLFTFFRLNTT